MFHVTVALTAALAFSLTAYDLGSTSPNPPLDRTETGSQASFQMDHSVCASDQRVGQGRL